MFLISFYYIKFLFLCQFFLFLSLFSLISQKICQLKNSADESYHTPIFPTYGMFQQYTKITRIKRPNSTELFERKMDPIVF